MLYQFPPPCYPFIFPSLCVTSPSPSHSNHLTLSLSLSLLPLSHSSFSSLFHSSLSLPLSCLSLLPIPNYQYIIAADLGAGFGLVNIVLHRFYLICRSISMHHHLQSLKKAKMAKCLNQKTVTIICSALLFNRSRNLFKWTRRRIFLAGNIFQPLQLNC